MTKAEAMHKAAQEIEQIACDALARYREWLIERGATETEIEAAIGQHAEQFARFITEAMQKFSMFFAHDGRTLQ